MSDRTPEEIERDRKVAEELENNPNSVPQFDQTFKAPETTFDPNYGSTLTPAEQADSTRPAQERVLQEISNEMADTTLANIRALAPKDEFEIPEGSGIKYTRQKIRPKDLRKLRIAQEEFNKAVNNAEMPIEEKTDKEFQLIFAKAEIYLGMTEQQFEETDYELLQAVIQATELRTQGFRKRK